ncbi:unnamed protein product [Nippostrongylus brasiliensis]|uniref:CUB domain-containing protein n=1 Tax=Nippostrongylus brasiliensis TaxID=27835 RepID=A0A158R2N1_NIPBR|nr:unnamed protein product [Nippostrongylus brasiliensis]
MDDKGRWDYWTGELGFGGLCPVVSRGPCPCVDWTCTRMRLILFVLLLALTVNGGFLDGFKNLLGDGKNLGQKLKNATIVGFHKLFNNTAFLNVREKLKNLKAKVRKTLELTPELMKSLKERLKKLRLIKKDVINPAGDSVDEVNEHANIAEELFQGDIVLTELSPAGTRIEVKIVSFNKGLATDGCIYGGVEVNSQEDQQLTGYRFCAPEDAGTTLRSYSSRVPIMIYNRAYRTDVELQYRFVRGNDPRPVGPSVVNPTRPFVSEIKIRPSVAIRPSVTNACRDEPICDSFRMIDICKKMSVEMLRQTCPKRSSNPKLKTALDRQEAAAPAVFTPLDPHFGLDHLLCGRQIQLDKIGDVLLRGEFCGDFVSLGGFSFVNTSAGCGLLAVSSSSTRRAASTTRRLLDGRLAVLNRKTQIKNGNDESALGLMRKLRSLDSWGRYPSVNSSSPVVQATMTSTIRVLCYVIQSPYYPSFYPPSTMCYYYLTAEPGKVLRFNFTHFNVETCCDFVTIYDGDSQGSKVLVQIGGPNGNISDPVTSFTSTQRFALVTFQSDALIQMTGFEFVYDSVFTALPCNRDIVLMLSGLATLGTQENFQKQLDFVGNVLTPQWQIGANKVNVEVYLMDALHHMQSLVPDVKQNNDTNLQCIFKYAQAAVSYQASDNLKSGIEKAIIVVAMGTGLDVQRLSTLSYGKGYTFQADYDGLSALAPGINNALCTHEGPGCGA